MSKYLDSTGLAHLWSKIIAEDRKSAVKLSYNEGTKQIELKDGTGAIIAGSGIDAAPFLKDGMLDDVTIVTSSTEFPVTYGVDAEGNSKVYMDGTKFIAFYWNVNADGDPAEGDQVKVDYLKVDEIGKVYTAGDGVSLEDDVVSIVEVEATKTKTTKAIPVAGGPLESLLKDAGITEIAEGTSMEDVLFSLICKELWPVDSDGVSNVLTSDATLVSTMNTPSLTYNGKSTNNQSSTVEVGSSVSYSASTAASSYTATPHRVTGLTYGYSAANDNTKDSTDTTKSAAFGTISPVADSVPTLILSGKVTETVNGTAGSKDAAAATKSGNVVIAEGDNKIIAKGTSIAFTGTCSKLDVVYGCSNLGKTENNGTTYPSTEKDAATLTSTAVTSGAITINCVGAYKYFYGYPDAIPASKADIVALANKGFLSGTTLSINTAGTVPLGKYMVVAVPKGWEYTSFVNGMNLDDVSAFYTDTTEVDYTLDNGTVVKYSVHWCGPFGADTNYNSFKLTKK